MSDYVPASAEALARLHAREALGAIVEILRSPSAAPQDRLRAAAMLLDRGHGKPTQAVVTVPLGRTGAARLAAMSTASLLAIVQRAQGEGGTPQNEGPNGGAKREGYPLQATCPLQGVMGDSQGVMGDSQGVMGDSQEGDSDDSGEGDSQGAYPEQQRDRRLERKVGSPRPNSRFETDDMIDVPSTGGIPQNEGPKAPRLVKGTPIGHIAPPEQNEDDSNPWD